MRVMSGSMILMMKKMIKIVLGLVIVGHVLALVHTKEISHEVTYNDSDLIGSAM